MPLQGTELAIVIVLFALVSAIGFGASRWRKSSELSLDDWALAGRGFRSWISWFVVGGDLYTAYTYVAVPALLFGSGAIGFYALPYVAIEYPLVYLIMIRLWSVCKTHGYVTSADFVRARFGSPTLALAVAITGIVATMPYIALNLLGIQAVLLTMGITGSWPLIIAFVVLAAFTYKSGVRAPALISFVKDGLVYLVIAVAIFYIPAKLGGWTHIFDSYNAHFKATPPGTANLLTSANQWQYITLALGSAFAIFLYPHSVTGVLTTRSRAVVKRTHGRAAHLQLHPAHQPAVLHRPAAARRRDHPADAAVGDARPVHPVAAPPRADRRLGGRHDRVRVDLLPDPQPGSEGTALGRHRVRAQPPRAQHRRRDLYRLHRCGG